MASSHRPKCNCGSKWRCLTGEALVPVLMIPFADCSKFEHRIEGQTGRVDDSESRDELPGWPVRDEYFSFRLALRCCLYDFNSVEIQLLSKSFRIFGHREHASVA
jgi:hypothetical protein